MNRFAVIFLTVIVAGCGGGGGSSPEPIPVQPTVKVTLSKPKAFVNEPVTITWESTNATSCVATSGITGTKPTNGSVTFSLIEGGVYNYSISCSGAGGTSSSSVKLVVPMQVYATSYENKNLANTIHTQIYPYTSATVGKTFAGEKHIGERSITIGDFFQEGTYSAFVHSLRLLNIYNVSGVPSDSPGVVYFLARNERGEWIDRTTELIKDSNDRLSCISNSYSIVADFNNDKKPDVYMACTGVDADVGITSLEEKKKVYLSYQYVYLSQSDGTYKKVEVPFNLYGHKASAGDINKDGNIDIITVNQGFDEVDPIVLLGQGNGTFVKSTNILPSNLRELTKINDLGLFQVDLIPIDGRLDVFFGASGAWPFGESTIAWIKGNINGGFDFSTVKNFPRVRLSVTNVNYINGTNYLLAYDILYKNENFYMLKGNQFDTGSHWGTDYAVIKYSAKDFSSSIIYQYSTYYTSALYKPHSSQIKFNKDGFIRAYTTGCGKDIASVNAGMCSMKMPE